VQSFCGWMPFLSPTSTNHWTLSFLHLGINGEGELRRHLANQDSHGKMAAKTEYMCVCVFCLSSNANDYQLITTSLQIFCSRTWYRNCLILYQYCFSLNIDWILLISYKYAYLIIVICARTQVTALTFRGCFPV